MKPNGFAPLRLVCGMNLLDSILAISQVGLLNSLLPDPESL